MKYREFIEEIEQLLGNGSTLFDAKGMHADTEFRAWRHQVTAVIDAIERTGHKVSCSIRSRTFGRPRDRYMGTHVDDLKREYNRELQDTLNELSTLVDHFKRFGEPPIPGKPEPAARASTQPISDGSLGWLWNHVSWKLWGTLIFVLLLCFTLGIRFARSEYFERNCVSEKGEVYVGCDPIKLLGTLKP